MVRDTIQAVQPQKKARSLKFLIEEAEGLYYMYLCSENKGPDQLCGISCMVTAQSICSFVFAHAKENSYDATQLLLMDVVVNRHFCKSYL